MKISDNCSIQQLKVELENDNNCKTAWTAIIVQFGI